MQWFESIIFRHLYAPHCVLSNKRKVNKKLCAVVFGISRFLQVRLILFWVCSRVAEGGDCNSPAKACRFESYHTHQFLQLRTCSNTCILEAILFPNNKASLFSGMAEWSIALVLKTRDCNRSVGSNPTPAANYLWVDILTYKPAQPI